MLALVVLLGFIGALESEALRIPHPSIDKYARSGVRRVLPGTDSFFLSVVDFGARGDNVTDNTKAFAAAISSASDNASAGKGGSVILVPPGFYRFSGHFEVPKGITLKGSYDSVPSHDISKTDPQEELKDGTIFIPTEGRGQEDAVPFITIHENGLVKGIVIYYEEQETSALPVPYPWTLHLDGNNAAVTDVELLGAWNGINATLAHRHYIARVQGQPINIGVLVDATYDIGRIEDVHFNPWYSNKKDFMKWQLTHGRSFVFGRSDWEYVFNTFSFGYAIGYHFIKTPTGTMNGNFLGIGADLAINASVQVDASQAAGILIANGEFTAFHTEGWLPGSTVESTQVVIGPDNGGPVKFADCSFWGPSSQIALINGKGTTSFTGCEFVQWDLQAKDGRAAIRALGTGSLILQGNTFSDDKNQVEIGPDMKKAVIMGNILTGSERITVVNNATNVQIGLNAAG